MSQVPAEFKPTLSTRGWIIEPFGRNPYWTAVVALAPALLGTILIFMDQQITAVIINRKEHKLKVSVCGTRLTCVLDGSVTPPHSPLEHWFSGLSQD
ncbi:hypothetical protein PR048_033163 [Dryococelus australis]|uniref:Bicarbonate transporter-like transmembrane domain-containing protein n=1 Tax=Dryococelus australis TaxID=614101 RepID=A0ABQ9FZH3_9NEOP|nr:hypothetical protein PR048_033163 [Dryococelus australis]